MYKKESVAIVSLAAVMAFRMLGLFMLLPVLPLYTNQILFATPARIGLAFGVYGLLQFCFQIPFGVLSDRVGRKPVILTGLIFLGTGSILSALSHSIYGIIAGRALQGAGAIGSTVLAMIADLTSDEERSKAMALVGIVICCAFVAAFIAGPMINMWFHLNGIFYTTAIFSALGIIVLLLLVPTVSNNHHHRYMLSRAVESRNSNSFFCKKGIFSNVLLRLDFGIFSLHCILTAMFIGVPVILSRVINLTEHVQMLLYLVILLFSFVMAVPAIVIFEKKCHPKYVVSGAVTLLAISQVLLMAFYHSTIAIGLTLFLFFIAFILLEAILPSLVSKNAPVFYKGTALGVYSSAQFFGIFFGSSVGGWIFGYYQWIGILIFCTIIALLWLLLSITM
ncbi:MFS transporter, partial [Coxiella endosymbiont of Amblyomma americanum]|uniref:MFS transporter n=1 Tax=Coxiella endosymbiont of Amblyomma americanum TaxID=325775 RepID=UPI00057C6BFE